MTVTVMGNSPARWFAHRLICISISAGAMQSRPIHQTKLALMIPEVDAFRVKQNGFTDFYSPWWWRQLWFFGVVSTCARHPLLPSRRHSRWCQSACNGNTGIDGAPIATADFSFSASLHRRKKTFFLIGTLQRQSGAAGYKRIRHSQIAANCIKLPPRIAT